MEQKRKLSRLCNCIIWFRKSSCDGLPFILSEDDPFVCIDLDDVEETVLKMFQVDFRDIYKEISQSGKDVHIFVRGQIEKSFNNQIEKVEMYQANRCIAMTGNIEQFENSGVQKVLSKQINIISHLHPKTALEKKILIYRSSNIVPERDNVVEIMCRYKVLFEGSHTSGDASKDDFSFMGS